MAERDLILDAWDEHIYGIPRAEMHPFTPGTSARRVAIQNNEEKEYKPYIEDGDADYTEKYLKEELKTALLVSKFNIYFYSLVNVKRFTNDFFLFYYFNADC